MKSKVRLDRIKGKVEVAYDSQAKTLDVYETNQAMRQIKCNSLEHGLEKLLEEGIQTAYVLYANGSVVKAIVNGTLRPVNATKMALLMSEFSDEHFTAQDTVVAGIFSGSSVANKYLEEQVQKGTIQKILKRAGKLDKPFYVLRRQDDATRSHGKDSGKKRVGKGE